MFSREDNDGQRLEGQEVKEKACSQRCPSPNPEPGSLVSRLTSATLASLREKTHRMSKVPASRPTHRHHREHLPLLESETPASLALMLNVNLTAQYLKQQLQEIKTETSRRTPSPALSCLEPGLAPALIKHALLYQISPSVLILRHGSTQERCGSRTGPT